MGSETRKKSKVISVRCSLDEFERIEQNASKTSLPTSTFLRQLALGYEPKSTVDQQAIHRLALLNGDLGRVGGLLRMWLSNEERAGFAKTLDVKGLVADLRSLLTAIKRGISEL